MKDGPPRRSAADAGALRRHGVELVEQPLPAADDEALRHANRPSVAICADESAHGIESLQSLAGKYDAINIKLDKTGGLTAALAIGARRAIARLQDHGGLHAGDISRHGARISAGALG